MNDATEALAKKRFMIMSLVRLMGIPFVVGGLMNMTGKLLPEFSPWLGVVLLLIGILDIMVIPPILARKWKSPDA
jgi:hypothetical protein